MASFYACWRGTTMACGLRIIFILIHSVDRKAKGVGNSRKVHCFVIKMKSLKPVKDGIIFI